MTSAPHCRVISAFITSPAQRTAVKQRPHQETGRCQVATSEPVVLHHGREGGGEGGDEVRPSAFNGLLDSEPSVWFDAPERLSVASSNSASSVSVRARILPSSAVLGMARI